MHQRVHGNHRGAGLEPERPLVPRADQKAGERHGQELVRDTPNRAEGADQCLLLQHFRIGGRRAAGGLQLVVYPADKIAVGDISNEEKEAEGGLVQPSIS